MIGKNGSYFDHDLTLKGHYIVTGNTNDNYCNDLLQMTDIRQEIHRHLLEQGFDAVFFFDYRGMLYCFDYRSYNILLGTEQAEQPTQTQAAPRDEFDALEEEGPFGSALSAFHQTDTQSAPQPAPRQTGAANQQLHMGTRSMGWAWQQVITLLQQGTYRCALVLSNINSMQTSFSVPALQALQELTASRSEKSSIAVYLFRGSTLVEMLNNQADHGTPEWNIFFQSVLRPLIEAEDPEENRVISLRTPNAAEIRNLLNYLRTKAENPLHMDVRQIRTLARSISYGCARSNWSLKQLRSRLERYAQDNPGFVLTMDNYSRATGLPRHTTALEDLERLIGLGEVKTQFRELYDSICTGTVRTDFPETSSRFAPLPATNCIRNHRLNICLMGNPGTGKSELARLVGRLYYEAGALPQGHLVEASAGNIVTQNVGGTAMNMRALVQQALGGVLFIDEAYALLSNPHGREAIDQLVNDMTAYEGQFAVVIAGYTRRMERFLKANEGLASRIGTTYHLPDYTPEEMHQILDLFIARDEDNLVLSEDLERRMDIFCSNWANDHGSEWGNAREAGRLVGLMKQAATARLQRSRRYIPGMPIELTLEDLPENYRKHLKPKAQSLEEALQEMENMVGLDNVKVYLRELIQNIRWGATASSPGRFLFHGPSGTGKTHVARLLGVMLQRLGVLKRDFVYEIAAQDLLHPDDSMDYGDNQYPTPQQILQAAVDNARGGTLFIDEAHQLNTPEGRAVLRALIPIVESEEFRKDTCLIMAGYTAEIREMMRVDDGFGRRFPLECRIRFDHYTAAELAQILKEMAEDLGQIPTQEYLDRTQAALGHFLENSPPLNYGDAGFIRDTYLPRSIKARSARLNERYLGDRNGIVSEEVAANTPDQEKKELTARDIPDQFRSWAGPLGLPVPPEKTIWQRIDELVGKDEVRKYLHDRRKQSDGNAFYDGHTNVGLNFAVVGPTGSGRHTVTRTMTSLWKQLGLLDRDEVRFVSKGDLEAGYVGQTAIRTNAVVEQAMGGCLAVEYPSSMLANGRENSFGMDALGVICGAMGTSAEKLSVVLLDTEDGLQELFRQVPSIKSQISHVFHLDNLTPDDMLQLFRIKTGSSMTFEQELQNLLPDFFLNWVSQRGGLGDATRSWGNGTEVDHLAEELIAQWESRSGRTVHVNNVPMRLITREMFPQELQKFLVCTRADKETAMKELTDLPGLHNVKTAVRNLERTIRMIGKGCAPGCYAFLGNPGSGKTTVARLLGGVFRSAGALSQGHVIERTAQQVMSDPAGFDDLLKLARDGILFIDEAPQLGQYDRGLQIIHRLLTALEDTKITGRTCIILAGYKDEMLAMFARDRGIASRFGTDEARILFDDYSPRELQQIMDTMAARADRIKQIPANHPLVVDDEFRAISGTLFEVVANGQNRDFGNARFVRNYLSDCYRNLLSRVDEAYPDGNYPAEALHTLTGADVTEKARKVAGTVRQPARISAGALDVRQQPPITPETYGDAVDYCARRTVLLEVSGESGHGTGSGTIISADGHILTCTHVIANAETVRAKVYCPGSVGGDYRWFDCQVLHPSFTDCDMALLKMDGCNFPYMPIRPADRSVQVTESTLLMGYPLGGMLNNDRLDDLAVSHFEGRIASSQFKLRQNKDILHYYLDSKGLHGNSGSPVISKEDGRLIGVFSGSLAPKNEGNLDELNLFFPISYFWERFVTNE